jgi:hypothetical protein
MKKYSRMAMLATAMMKPYGRVTVLSATIQRFPERR